MKSAKRGQKVPSGLIVKSKPNRRVIAIAIALALAGMITYVFAYQYTHSAKLEVELNKKESQLQKIQQLHQDSLNSSEQEQKQLEEKIKQLEADLQARNAEKVRIASLNQKTAQASSVRVTGTKAEWLAASNIKPSDWGYVDYIIGKESGWNPTARNKSSGAGGLPQALPYSKTGCAWGDAVCQLNWANNYAVNRYGSWAKAYSFWLNNKWW